MLNKDEVKKLKAGDAIVYHYLFINPTFQNMQKNAFNSIGRGKMLPSEGSVSGKVLRASHKRITIILDNGVRRSLEKDGFTEDGKYPVDSFLYSQISIDSLAKKD